MKSLFAALLVATAAPLTAAPHDVRALREAALKDDLAWNIVEGLTTEVGPRLAGTEAEARARAWSVARLKSLGFSNVRVETFELPVWVRGEEKAWVTAPFPQQLAITALGDSAATPVNGLEGQIAAFDSVDALLAAPDSAVRGKIVFIDHAMPRTQDGSSYPAFGRARREGPSIASRKGAAAIVIRSIGTDWHRNPHTGDQDWAAGVTPIPAGAVSNPDADQLKRILKRGRPVRMKLLMTPRSIGTQQSGNVIAEVPGSNPRLAPVLVGCHLDSWDLGTGAIDDGAGCAITAAAAKRILEAGRPLRTIRVVWFGAEEVGLVGGKDYHRRHVNEPHHVVAESDFGAGRVWKIDTKLGPGREAEAKALRDALMPLGIVPGSMDVASGPDLTAMIAAGVPALSLRQDGTDYFDLHHTPDDTLDKIDLGNLRQNVAAWTTMLAITANTPDTK
jgi:hypothetical protein